MGQYDEVKQDISEIKADIKDVKEDLHEHIKRWAASEARLDLMEDFVREAMTGQQSNFNAMLQSNKDNQAAMNKQLKILIGVFAGLATLVTAFAAFFS